jgi:uncharacterized protein YecE (DUF72 family)
VSTLNLEIPPECRGHLRLGTCSWKYESWKGLVYPADAKYSPDDCLRDYARLFNTVEVDQWFWSLFPAGVRLPDAAVVRRYAESVPADFVFSVKAPNAITLTHFYARQPKAQERFANQPNPHFLSRDMLQRFLDSLAPMGAKLGPIMFQFKYLNKTKMPSKEAFFDKLHEFFTRAPQGFCYAIECRNPNYLSPEFFDYLRRDGLGYVFLEGYFMPPMADVYRKWDTRNDAATIIRLHGPDRPGIEERTGAAWNRIVDPKPQSLAAAAEIVRANVPLGRRTFVNVNNHFEGSAPLTIERFLKLLTEGEPPPFELPQGGHERGRRAAP